MLHQLWPVAPNQTIIDATAGINTAAAGSAVNNAEVNLIQ
jgi:hypothetical protein